jgi:hypothetical protein
LQVNYRKMANPKIEVEIGAVIDGLRKGFGESVKIIETLEKQALDLDRALKAATDLPEIQGLNAKLAQTKAALSQLKSSGIDPLTKATSNYNSVGVDFARIIQDAPFGIIGVGNNITQLAGSFQVLKNQTGSTSAALKQSFASIFSSGNALILGISVLTTVLTVLQQNGFFKTEQAAKSLGERLEQYREKLEGVTKANLEGQIAAQKEISNLKLLQTQAENTSLSQQKRNQAVSELQKQYPEYLKGLTEEQIKTGEVGEAYNKLTNDIVALAKAKALSAELDKQSGDLLTLRLQEEQRANEILQLREKLQVAINNKVDAGARVAGQFTAENDDAMLIQMNIDKLIKEQLKSANDRNKIIKDQLFIESQIVEQSSLGANFVKQTGKGIDENKDKLEKYSAAWDDYNLQQEIAREFQDKLTESTKGYQQEIDKVARAIADVPRIGESGSVKIKTEIEGFEEETAEPMPFENFLDLVAFQLDKLPELEQRVADFAKTVNDLLKGSVTDAFIDLGYTIGETLASGGNVLKAVGGSLLKSFGKFLGQFGQQLIAYGVAASAFGKVSAALANPASAIIAAPLAIAAGIALTAIAGAIGGLGSKGPGGGGGGGGAGGGSAAAGGTSFAGGGQGALFQQNRDLNGELVVRGQDLVYVFGQANDRINKG